MKVLIWSLAFSIFLLTMSTSLVGERENEDLTYNVAISLLSVCLLLSSGSNGIYNNFKGYCSYSESLRTLPTAISAPGAGSSASSRITESARF